MTLIAAVDLATGALKAIARTMGASVALIAMPVIRGMLRKKGMVFDPRALRRRSRCRMAEFADAVTDL